MHLWGFLVKLRLRISHDALADGRRTARKGFNVSAFSDKVEVDADMNMVLSDVSFMPCHEWDPLAYDTIRNVLDEAEHYRVDVVWNLLRVASIATIDVNK